MRLRKYKKMYTYHIKEMLYVSTCKKSILKLILFAGLFFLALVLVLIPQLIGNKECMSRHTRFPTDLKYILFWKTKQKKSKFSFNKGETYASGQSLFIKQNCEYINCFITYNRSFLKEDVDYDAIVFDVNDVRKLDKRDFNLSRSPHQKYIFKSFESSEKHPICNPSFDGYFNWTWTYKLNSDIPEPFFHIFDENKVLIGPGKNMNWTVKMKRTEKYLETVAYKFEAVAWIVTKCKAKNIHHEFIRELRKELKGYNYSLDTYGPCGPNKCPDGNIIECYKMIEKRYFFLLVLEDAYFVDDYVTDIVVKAMTYATLPIVLGGADYKNFLPPGSYINAQAFDLKKLGALIDFLIKNRQMYELFFDWKNHYHYTMKPKSYICNLCNKLNQNNNTIIRSNNKFRHWWNNDYRDVCQRTQLLGLFNNLK